MRRFATWKTAMAAIAFVAVFGAGYLAGANKYGKPSSILHVVTVKWTPESTPEQRQAALDGVEKMAGQIPGIKNIWLKSLRTQPRDFNATFAIEFEDQAAADRYPKHPAHAEWYKVYLPVRDQSYSHQMTN